ncbi:MAG: hypothetical protein CMI30_04205 [Opitutae bacterium]|nr:hypothetical protein [Opitutae bacterium]|tara:strand:- start:2587 stop:3267 length:681 start_codon:yes stop_codon:yes gene_type:complete
MFRKLRNSFVTGLLIFLPLGATLFVVNFLLGIVKDPAIQVMHWLRWDEGSVSDYELLVALIGLFVAVTGLTFIGFLSNYLFGKLFIRFSERILVKVPFVGVVYRTVKQIVDTFSKENRAVFQEVVLIEYPRPNCYALGFLTNNARGEVEEKTGKSLANVFLPTTPNPTSGYLLMLPREEVQSLEMSVGEGMKMIISGGAVIPEYGKVEQPEETKEIEGKASPEEGD